MSLRNFYRSFEAATGQSPATWVETMRIENAKRLLSQATGEAEGIAFESGFGGYERMRRTFIRRLGISPTTRIWAAVGRSARLRRSLMTDRATRAGVASASGGR